MNVTRRLTPEPYTLRVYSVTFHWLYCNDVSAVIAQQYVGCYRDSGGDNRVMSSNQITHDSMTIDMCQQHCQQSTWTYFGLEVGYQPCSSLRYTNSVFDLCEKNENKEEKLKQKHMLRKMVRCRVLMFIRSV